MLATNLNPSFLLILFRLATLYLIEGLAPYLIIKMISAAAVPR
jgi:hypothetical protein